MNQQGFKMALYSVLWLPKASKTNIQRQHVADNSAVSKAMKIRLAPIRTVNAQIRVASMHLMDSIMLGTPQPCIYSDFVYTWKRGL